MMRSEIIKKRFQFNFLAFFLILGAVLIIATIGYRFFIRAKMASFRFPQAEPEITFFLAKKQNIELFEEFPARVVSSEMAEIRPQVSGTILEINFQEGGFVKEGQQLYLIDSTAYKVGYKASFKAATEKKNRYEQLLKRNKITESEYQKALDELSAAKSNAKLAENNVSNVKIYAPISGFISSSNVTKGAFATPQTGVMATITKLDNVYIEMTQSIAEFSKLGSLENRPVSLILQNGEYPLQGVIKFSETIVDKSTDSLKIRANISNPDAKLFPGMFVRAKIHLKPINEILVPQKSSFRGQDGTLNVWIVDEKESVVKKRQIIAEKTFEDKWIVTEGLNEDEEVLLEGMMKVREGAKVKAVYSKI